MGKITEAMELQTLTVVQNLYVPAGAISNADFTTDTQNRLASSKAVHLFDVGAELTEQNTTIVAVEKLLHIVQGAAATLNAVEVICVTAPTGDYATTIDLQKSTGGGAFATVLSAVITVNSGTTALTATAGTISSAALVDGDILKAVVAVSGTSGAQGKGLLASVTLSEDPA